MNPQHARWYFKFRSLLNFLGVAIVFAVVVTVAAQIDGGFFIMLIAAGIGYFLYFHVLENQAVSIACPECRKVISTNTPWICGVCGKANTRTNKFPFIHRCEHGECGAEPKAYKCHHRGCGKLIFLTDDCQEENFARCLTAPVPPAPDETKEEISAQEREKRRLEHQLVITRLNAELNEAKKLVDPPKKKPIREIIEEDYTRYNTRYMIVYEIAAREKKANAEKYKDDPEMLERTNLSVDTWLHDKI
jgi:hypothetical protein